MLVTGGYDPLHSGHIEYFTAAKQLGNMLVVGLNSDDWLTRKKGKPFLLFEERKRIIENLKMVDCVFGFDDNDNTALAAIRHIREKFPWAKVVFANGGDRLPGNTPEISESDVEFVFNVGGPRLNSSSRLLEEWSSNLDRKYQIKELSIHTNRTVTNHTTANQEAFLYVLDGIVTATTTFNGITEQVNLQEKETYRIGPNIWYSLTTPSVNTGKILEIQHTIG